MGGAIDPQRAPPGAAAPGPAPVRTPAAPRPREYAQQAEEAEDTVALAPIPAETPRCRPTRRPPRDRTRSGAGDRTLLRRPRLRTATVLPAPEAVGDEHLLQPRELAMVNRASWGRKPRSWAIHRTSRGGRRKLRPERYRRATMADEDRVVIEHPNRRKASSQLARLVVIVLLLASAAVVLLVSLGGWDTIEGASPCRSSTSSCTSCSRCSWPAGAAACCR